MTVLTQARALAEAVLAFAQIRSDGSGGAASAMAGLKMLGLANTLLAALGRTEPSEEAVVRELVKNGEQPNVPETLAVWWVRAVRAATERAKEGR